MLDLSLDHSSWYLIWMERAPEYVCKVCGNTLSPQEGYQVWIKHSAFPKRRKFLRNVLETNRRIYFNTKNSLLVWTFPWSTCDCRMHWWQEEFDNYFGLTSKLWQDWSRGMFSMISRFNLFDAYLSKTNIFCCNRWE